MMEWMVISLVCSTMSLILAFLVRRADRSYTEKYRDARNNISLDLSRKALNPERWN